MNNRPPNGWDEARIKRTLANYEQQTADEAVVEDEAGVRPSETVVSVPRDLVSEIRKLIAKRQR